MKMRRIIIAVLVQSIIVCVAIQIGKIYTHQREISTITYNDETGIYECTVYDLYGRPIDTITDEAPIDVIKYPDWGNQELEYSNSNQYLDNVVIVTNTFDTYHWRQYINRQTREVSRMYASPKASYLDKIAYYNFSKGSLVISDIFDKEKLYMEINRNFGSQLNVTFKDDQTIQIEYSPYGSEGNIIEEIKLQNSYD